MLTKHQQSQLDGLIDCGLELEQALNVLINSDIITYEQANYVYDRMRN